jgi:hypothetical protein
MKLTVAFRNFGNALKMNENEKSDHTKNYRKTRGEYGVRLMSFHVLY